MKSLRNIHPLWWIVGTVLVLVIVFYLILNDPGAPEDLEKTNIFRRWWFTALRDASVGDVVVILLIYAIWRRKD